LCPALPEIVLSLIVTMPPAVWTPPPSASVVLPVMVEPSIARMPDPAL
jgi:hypothetical protein